MNSSHPAILATLTGRMRDHRAADLARLTERAGAAMNRRCEPKHRRNTNAAPATNMTIKVLAELAEEIARAARELEAKVDRQASMSWPDAGAAGDALKHAAYAAHDLGLISDNDMPTFTGETF